MTKNKRHPIKQTTRDIWKLSDEGLGAPEIAKRLNTTNFIVTGAIARGRASGECNKKVRTVATVFNKTDLTWGYIGQVINVLSPDQAEWLLTSAEDCGCKTSAEYIAELVLDAYEEHKTKETANASK